MPTYDYECLQCGHTFEQFHGIKAPYPPCPECGKDVRRKIGTGAGLLFKGSGYYITDYRSESYKKASKAEQSSSTTPAKDTAKTETKSKPESTAKKPATPAKSAT